MNILFFHRNFPGQFQHLVTALARNPMNSVFFITDDENKQINGVTKLVYKIEQDVPEDCHPYLKNLEEAVMHGQNAADIALMIKQRGIKPDVIFSFPWGGGLFMKDIFPDVPLILYCEWFYNADSADIKFSGINLTEDERAHIRCKNSKLFLELDACDIGISPTNWQKSQFPKEYQDKIKVLHEGIDTEFFVPDENAKFIVKDKGLELSAADEVITYVTRGMEPYRGFPQFMQVIEKLLKTRPNAHFIIAGDDVACYGQALPDGMTYKEKMLKELDIDLNRVHFVGTIPSDEYLKLLQISSAHIYLTYPFVLSWSLLEAMSTGCCIIASDTQPVLEVMEDNLNGLLVNLYDVQQIQEKVEFALDNKDKMKEIRENARQTVIDKYSLRDSLAQQISLLKIISNQI